MCIWLTIAGLVTETGVEGCLPKALQLLIVSPLPAHALLNIMLSQNTCSLAPFSLPCQAGPGPLLILVGPGVYDERLVIMRPGLTVEAYPPVSGGVNLGDGFS